mmetsp:Transcript_6257/g.38919  ORF Transcript_6257/g.38919 Transcript_6257/m.38919 type:complete len:378 (-) Transcript_6257:458-1591(-)
MDVGSGAVEHTVLQIEDPSSLGTRQGDRNVEGRAEVQARAGWGGTWSRERQAESVEIQDLTDYSDHASVSISEAPRVGAVESGQGSSFGEGQSSSGAERERSPEQSGTTSAAGSHRGSGMEVALTRTQGTLPLSDNPPNLISFRNDSPTDNFHILVVQDPDGYVSNIVWKGLGGQVVSTGDATEHQAPSVRVVQQPWTHESTIMDLHDPHALLIFRILCGLLAVDVLYTLAIFIYTMIGTDPVDDSQKFDPAVPFLLPILSGRGLAFLLLGGTILVCISGYIGGKQVRTNLLVFAFFACIALIIVSAVDAFSLETLVKVAVFFLCIYLRRILIKRAEMYGITLARIVRAPRRLTRPPCAPFVTVVVPERQLDSEEGV